MSIKGGKFRTNEKDTRDPSTLCCHIGSNGVEVDIELVLLRCGLTCEMDPCESLLRVGDIVIRHDGTTFVEFASVLFSEGAMKEKICMLTLGPKNLQLQHWRGATTPKGRRPPLRR